VETARLTIRRLEPSDAAFILALLNVWATRWRTAPRRIGPAPKGARDCSSWT